MCTRLQYGLLQLPPSSNPSPIPPYPTAPRNFAPHRIPLLPVTLPPFRLTSLLIPTLRPTLLLTPP